MVLYDPRSAVGIYMVQEGEIVFGNLLQDHEEGEIDCPSCEEQFGFCSCGGIIHCEYQEAWSIEGPTNVKILECDRCDDYETE